MSFEVHRQQIPVGLRFAEQPDQRGLAHLPCAAQDQGLASGPLQPSLHVQQAMTVHADEYFICMPMKSRRDQVFIGIFSVS